jgi:pyruvate dehydrogenase E1 component beta subunit
VVFLEHELLYGDEFPVVQAEYRLGEAAVLRTGSDWTLVSFSRPVKFCLEAAEVVSKHGIECEVIDLRTLRPLDMGTILRSLSKTKKVLLVEEGWPYSGITSEIMARINEEGWEFLDHPPLRICALDVPLPYAANLESMCLPTTDKIVTKLLAVG